MQKKLLSYLAVACIAVAFIFVRWYYSPSGNGYEVKVTTYDALGYYMYLPGIFIYEDVTQLDWFFENDSLYQLAGGGRYYQIHLHTNNNYVFKYFGGIALLQLPFFAIAHQYALHSHYPPDGFSPPYQYAIAWGNVCYAILAFLLLRVILRRYFTDKETAITLLLVGLATNLIQYVSVDSGQSHGYIFPLYVVVLYATIKWHEQPKWSYALLAGWIIGIATMARPTEAIMVLIPILWGTQTKALAAQKWNLVKRYKYHAYGAAVMGFLGVLPQLIYWKHSAGSFIFDVGSKWTFLNPWFRVLVGFEKGWFIYTPITVLFIIGMFYMKKYPFKKAVLWFGLLNIYIVISWWDWRYGGSYSTRALSQATAVYALPLAAFVHHVMAGRWRWLWLGLGAYFIALNAFQIYQYNHGILHFDHMNARYYQQIYWNAAPTPAQTSLLDTPDFVADPNAYSVIPIFSQTTEIPVNIAAGQGQYLLYPTPIESPQGTVYIEVKCKAQLTHGFWDNYFTTSYMTSQDTVENKIRVFRPMAAAGYDNPYHYFMAIPAGTKGTLSIGMTPLNGANGALSEFEVNLRYKN